MLIAGVDEAGRGPVIGPMVIACTVINHKNLKKLEAIGVKDSKELSPNKREFLAKKLKKLVRIFIEIIEPIEIDKAVESKSTNLNMLEAKKTASLIARANVDKVFIDCPSNNINAYKTLLKKLIKNKTDKKIELVVEHKAERHPIVAAASIIAKVLRDQIVKDLKQKIGVDFGSGYPSDPITQEFITKLEGDEDFLRSSWITAKRVLNKKHGQKRLLDF